VSAPRDEDEASALKREMESHLEMLEADARKFYGPATETGTAARYAEERFGNAVAHFRSGLAQWEGRQRALQRIVVMVALVALVIVAAGVTASAWIMVETRRLVSDWSVRATPVEPDWGVLRFDAVLLEFRALTAKGEVRTDGRLSLHDWNEVVRLHRGRGEANAGTPRVSCGDFSWPVIELNATPSVLVDQPLFAASTTITCTPTRVFDARATSQDFLSNSDLVQALASGEVIDCVPVQYKGGRGE
jgi:hypothetical protein